MLRPKRGGTMEDKDREDVEGHDFIDTPRKDDDVEGHEFLDTPRSQELL
jgi:hypothetical protein